MRADPNSIAYRVSGSVTTPFGPWPVAGFLSIAYRLANVRTSRLGAVLAASAIFYFC